MERVSGRYVQGWAIFWITKILNMYLKYKIVVKDTENTFPKTVCLMISHVWITMHLIKIEQCAECFASACLRPICSPGNKSYKTKHKTKRFCGSL